MSVVILFAGLCCTAWLAISVVDTSAAILRGERRFSLRTLMLAMTLIAAVLGAVVYVVK